MGERGVSIGNTIVTAAAQESRVCSMEEILENLARESVRLSIVLDGSNDEALELGGVGADLTRIPSPSLSRLGMLIFRLIPSSTLHFVVLCFPNVGADFSTIDGLYRCALRKYFSFIQQLCLFPFFFLFLFLDTDKSSNFARNLLKVYRETGIFLYFYINIFFVKDSDKFIIRRDY